MYFDYLAGYQDVPELTVRVRECSSRSSPACSCLHRPGGSRTAERAGNALPICGPAGWPAAGRTAPRQVPGDRWVLAAGLRVIPQRDHEPEPVRRGLPGFLLPGEGRRGLQHLRAKALAQHIGDDQRLVLSYRGRAGHVKGVLGETEREGRRDLASFLGLDREAPSLIAAHVASLGAGQPLMLRLSEPPGPGADRAHTRPGHAALRRSPPGSSVPRTLHRHACSPRPPAQR